MAITDIYLLDNTEPFINYAGNTDQDQIIQNLHMVIHLNDSAPETRILKFTIHQYNSSRIAYDDVNIQTSIAVRGMDELDSGVYGVKLEGIAIKTINAATTDITVTVEYADESVMAKISDHIPVIIYDFPIDFSFVTQSKTYDVASRQLIMNDTHNLSFFNVNPIYDSSSKRDQSAHITQLSIEVNGYAETITVLPASFYTNQACVFNQGSSIITYNVTFSVAFTNNVAFAKTYTLIWNGSGDKINYYSVENVFFASGETSTSIALLPLEADKSNGSIKLPITYTFAIANGAAVPNKQQSRIDIYRTAYGNVINTATDLLLSLEVDTIDGNHTFTYYDATPESGIAYTYQVALTVYWLRKENCKTIMSTPQNSEMLFFDNIFLMTKDQILKFRYNVDVSGLKYNVADTVTPTLGGAYPFVRRNGSQRYRTFTLKGLFSLAQEAHDTRDYAMNVGSDSKFLAGLNQESPFTQWSNRCASILNASSLSVDEKEVLLERIYREAVSAFLHEPNVKLFKSSQEGNMFVYINAISFQPETKLGRNIYSISCTCTEVAPYTTETCRLYFTPTQAYTYAWNVLLLSDATWTGTTATIQTTDILQGKNSDFDYRITYEPYSFTIQED